MDYCSFSFVFAAEKVPMVTLFNRAVKRQTQRASTLMELPVPLFEWSSSGGPPLVALQSRCQHPKRKPKCAI